MATIKIPVRMDVLNLINDVIGYINKVNEIENIEEIDDIELLRGKIIDLQNDRHISVFDIGAKLLLSRLKTIGDRAIEINDEVILEQLQLIGIMTNDEKA